MEREYDDYDPMTWEDDDEGDYDCAKCGAQWKPEYQGRRCPVCDD